MYKTNLLYIYLVFSSNNKTAIFQTYPVVSWLTSVLCSSMLCEWCCLDATVYLLPYVYTFAICIYTLGCSEFWQWFCLRSFQYMWNFSVCIRVRTAGLIASVQFVFWPICPMLDRLKIQTTEGNQQIRSWCDVMSCLYGLKTFQAADWSRNILKFAAVLKFDDVLPRNLTIGACAEISQCREVYFVFTVIN